ncbi:MAG: DUF2029 domain-containing protein [Beijerinckiaceae bacterium]|nr:DUF2029 domain-containing protein [Beijerinckiaceae bacterium]
MRTLSNPLVHKAVAVFAMVAFAMQLIRFHLRAGMPKPWPLTDYDIFHLAGTLALQGEYEKAYGAATFLPFHKAFSGVGSFLTWTYPPQFGLIVAPLASIDITLGYFVFMSATLAAYILVLRKLARDATGAAFTLLFPSILLTLLTGQNGFLTAALMGLSCTLLMAKSNWAGASLGLMVIKPHLAVTLGLYTFATRQWGVVAMGAVTVLATALAATLAFGPDIWLAFLGSVAEARNYLDKAAYPLHRMVSLYATLRTLGVNADAAFAVQIAIGLAAVAAAVTVSLKPMPQRQALGMIVFLGLFVSPYACDYDLPILGIALGLLLPELVRRASTMEEALMMILAWGASFWGFGMQRAHQYFGTELAPGNNGPSLGGVFMLLLLALVWRILNREPRLATAPPLAPARGA